MPTEVMRRLYEDLSNDLDIIARRFKLPPKITLIVRNQNVADGDVFLTNDDFELAIAAVRKLESRESTLVATMDTEPPDAAAQRKENAK